MMIFYFFVLSEAYALRPQTVQARKRVMEEQKIESGLLSFEAPPLRIEIEESVSDNLKRDLQRVVQGTVRQVGNDFGYTPAEPATVMLLQGNTYQSIDDPEIASGGFYQNRKIRIRFDYKKPPGEVVADFQEVFRHEYTHLVIASLDGGRTPRWLDEGLAVYEQKGASGRKQGEGRAFYQKMKAAERLIPIREFAQADLRTQYSLQSKDFYEHGYILAKYLVDQFGFRKLRELLGTMKANRSFTDSLQSVYGLDLESLAQGAYQS